MTASPLSSTSDLPALSKHLLERGVTKDTPCLIVEETELVYFFLYSVGGHMLGFQRYYWKGDKLKSNDLRGRYHTWISPQYRPLAFWGMEFVQGRKEPLYITEGIFDALRIIQTGRLAAAMLTCSPSKEFVKHFRYLTMGRDVIAIKDNDGENKCSNGLDKLATRSYTIKGAKDIGELSVEDADEFLRGLPCCS